MSAMHGQCGHGPSMFTDREKREHHAYVMECLDNLKKDRKMYTVKEIYRLMQKECGIEIGDKVKVLRKFKDWEMGCDACWRSGKKERIGGIFTVKIVDTYSIVIDTDGDCVFPFFALELVEKAKPDKMITVEGKEYSESTLAKAMKEYVNGKS